MKTILKLLSKRTRAHRTQTSSISTASSSSIAPLSATIEPYALTLSPEFLSSRESSNKDSDKLIMTNKRAKYSSSTTSDNGASSECLSKQ